MVSETFLYFILSAYQHSLCNASLTTILFFNENYSFILNVFRENNILLPFSCLFYLSCASFIDHIPFIGLKYHRLS